MNALAQSSTPIVSTHARLTRSRLLHAISFGCRQPRHCSTFRRWFGLNDSHTRADGYFSRAGLLRTYLGIAIILGMVPVSASVVEPAPAVRNIVFILTDDHRFDAFGFMGHSFLQTPNLDSVARNGVHFENAFVTTALCSPSRASILTGMYAHRHGVVDNNNPVRPDLIFFPQLLQRSGYRTGFFGKWHMGGESAAPQRGFDKWVSFAGQGHYAPQRSGRAAPSRNILNLLNIDGHEVARRGYITDELTDYVVEWIRTVPRDTPFFVYLSHKAVHSDFIPAERHIGRYKGKPLPFPASRLRHERAPMWVQDQRNSWHGVDFPYHSKLDVEQYYQRYCETLLAVDESVGRVLDELRARGQLNDTLVVYMSDNGFGFGEHGLIDKRTAYEWSMRVPLLMQCPSVLPAAGKIARVVANIDVAPTLLDAAGVAVPAGLDGQSFWPLARGEDVPWRSELLYEYYWERNFPQTPTVHALRSERYKYVHVHGLWDIDELYDLQSDPGETRNLIFEPECAFVVKQMNRRLFNILRETGGMAIPLQLDQGFVGNLRNASGAKAADFPPSLIQKSSSPP